MHYAMNNHKSAGLRYDPFKALVSPRPIGWIACCNKEGAVNLSPYSFFNAFSEKPYIVGFASNSYKDAVTFIEETREFTCSLVSYELFDAMNASSAPLPRGESEFDFAKLEQAPSQFVKPPRVKNAPASLECKYLQTIPMTSLEGETSYYLVLGQVVGVYINDDYIKDGLVDNAKMQIIARGGYNDYFKADEASIFSVMRPAGGG